jgi:hypothetical protein
LTTHELGVAPHDYSFNAPVDDPESFEEDEKVKKMGDPIITHGFIKNRGKAAFVDPAD